MANEDQPTRFQTVWINQALNPHGITVADDDEGFAAGLASARTEHEFCSLHQMTATEARELGKKLIATADKVEIDV